NSIHPNAEAVSPTPEAPSSPPERENVPLGVHPAAADLHRESFGKSLSAFATTLRERLSPYAIPMLALASLWPGVSTGMALATGVAVAIGLGNPYKEWTSKLTRPLLSASLVGLGAGMNL